MARTTPISDVMTTRVTTIPVGAPLSEARRLFSEEDIHHLPVVDEGRIVGILSTRDLIRAFRTAAPMPGEAVDDRLDRNATLRDTMTTELVTVGPEQDVLRAIDLVADGAIHSVLVVDEDRKLVGIATHEDLLDYLCS